MPRQRATLGRDVGKPKATLDTAARIRPDASRQVTAAQQTASQLAEGLAALAPGLGALSQDIDEKKRKADLAKAKQKALATERSITDTAELIKSGELLPHQSAWYVAGYNEQLGAIVADRLATERTVAIAENLPESTSVEEMREFVQNFDQQWMERNKVGDQNKFFMGGFSSRNRGHKQNAETQFASQIPGRLANAVDEALFTETIGTLTVDTANGIPIEQQGVAFTKHLRELAKLDPSPGANRRRNKTAIDAIVAFAIQNKNFEILGLLGEIESGGAPLGDTKYAIDQRTRAEFAIASRRTTEWEATARETKRIEREVTREVMGQALTELSENPFGTDLTAMALKLMPFNPQAAAILDQLSNNVSAISKRSDQRLLEDYATSIWNDDATVSETQIIEGVLDGRLTLPDASWLVGQLAAEERSHQRGTPEHAAITNPNYTKVLRDFKSAIAIFDGVEYHGERNAAWLAGQGEIQVEWMQWISQNPDLQGPGNDAAQIAFLNGMRDRMLLKWGAGEATLAEDQPPGAAIEAEALPDWRTEAVVGVGELDDLILNIRAVRDTGAVYTRESLELMRVLDLSIEDLEFFVPAQRGFNVITPKSED